MTVHLTFMVLATFTLQNPLPLCGSLALFTLHFFLLVQKETKQRKKMPEMKTTAFFGKMPLASRSQKKL
jgi:hypothetical protein